MAARQACHWCGGDAVLNTTCPKSIPCPHCKATVGQECRRPSGHRAATMHVQRIANAEQMDAERGIIYEDADGDAS